MADNKGEEEAMDTSSNSDTTTTTVPSAQDNTDPDASTKDDNAVIIIESDPTIKAGDEEKKTESPPENVVPPQAEAPPTPAATTTTNGGGGDANGAEANGNNSSSSTASPPTTTAENSTAEQPASVTTTPSPAPAPSAAAAAAAGGDVTNNNNNSGSSSGVGLTTEMSPPPPAAAPGGGTTTPASTTTTTPPAPLNLLDTCAVCKQNLQSREVCEPKLLPCLHSFCLKCIPQPDRQISVQVPGQHGLTDTHIVNVMRCSVCHQDYKQSDIIDNYFVKDTSEATSSFAEKAAQVCTSCEDNAGTIGFCVECNEWLCKTCVEAHQRVKITKDHKIRTMGDDSEAVAPGQRPVFCPVHRQEPLKLYCETCDTLTCRDCQLLEHKEHRYQFLEEAFQNQKGIIETHMTKLQEKKNYVHYSVSQVQSRIKELNETHRKVEHEIKIAVFTLINEINKKGKALLQQLESVTKERSMRLVTQHKDTAHLAHQINHVLNFCHWAITSGSSTALLYSKRLILFQLRHVLKARMEPAPQANGAVRFFCDPTFWAKNVVNLGNLVIEKPPQPPSAHPPPNMMAPGQPISPGQVHPGKHPPQINLAQLRLQHMQQAAYAQQKQQQHHQQQQQQHQQQQQQHQQQQQQHQQQQLQQQQQQQHAQAQQQQHQQQIQQQMRIASQLSQQHPRQAPPQMVQQQPPRLISMQQLPRGPGGMNGGPGPGPHMGYPSSHHMRLPGLPPPGRGMPTAQPRHNGQQYPSMMQPQLQRQHSNPGHAGPFPVASLHNANPTSPTSASMASAHAHRGPASPILGPIELIPSVTNPENLPCLPEIPPIQLEDAGSSNLGHILNRYLAASTNPMLGGLDLMNLSPGPIITHSPGSSGLSNNHTPARPSSTSSTGSRGSCSSAGRTLPVIGAPTEQVKVKQEPGAEDDYSCQSTGTSSNVKMERGKDAGRSACMMSSPESMSPLAVPVAPPSGQDVHRTHGGEHIKAEPGSEPSSCAGAPSTWTSTTMSATSSFQNNAATDRPLTNGNSSNKGTAESTGGGAAAAAATANSGAKEDDPNEDWCAVCVNGGDLLCCDRCPKVFHMKCHVPTIKIFPRGDFLCTFCRNLTNPEIEYTDDTKKAKVAEHGHMGHEDRRKCERLLLYIFCHELSVGFRDPVASSVPNYYKIIKHPMDLKKVKKKLQLRSSQYYKTLQGFVSDVRLVFNNCAKYNEMSRIIQVYDEEKQINNQVGSEMAISGKAVSMVFEEKLLEMYPDQSFPETPEDESAVEEEEEKEATDDSGDDFVQPRRKRLKLEEKVLQHIK